MNNYNKTNWIDQTTVISADALNNIEDGISNVNEAMNKMLDGATEDLDTFAEVKEALNNISLTPGPQGPQGEKGEKGDKGDKGEKGENGTFDATTTFPALNTSDKTVIGAINEVLQNLSNGKSSIAQAITSKGVTANASDSFATLSSKIKSIESKKYDAGYRLTLGQHYTFDEKTFYDNMSFYSAKGLPEDISLMTAGKGSIVVRDEDDKTVFYMYNETANKYERVGDVGYNIDGAIGKYGVTGVDSFVCSTTGYSVYSPSVETGDWNHIETLTEKVVKVDGVEDEYKYVRISFVDKDSEIIDGIPFPPKAAYNIEVYDLDDENVSYYPTFLGQVEIMGPPSMDRIESIATDNNHLIFRETVGNIISINLSTKQSVSIDSRYSNEEFNSCVVYNNTIIARDGNYMNVYNANTGSEVSYSSSYGMKVLNSEFIVKNERIYFITSTGNICVVNPNFQKINQFEYSNEIRQFVLDANNNLIVEFPGEGIGFTTAYKSIQNNPKCLSHREDTNTIILK